MKEVNSLQEFNRETQAPGWLLVYCTASWCGPCKTFSPVMNKVSLSFNSMLRSIRVDVETLQEMVERYGIRSVPTLLLFREGHVIEASIGVQSYEQLSHWLFKHMLNR